MYNFFNIKAHLQRLFFIFTKIKVLLFGLKKKFQKNVSPLLKIFYLSVNELAGDGFDNIETENNNLEQEDEDKEEDKMNCS